VVILPGRGRSDGLAEVQHAMVVIAGGDWPRHFDLSDGAGQ
jgi:hypothetical protein